MCKVLNAHHIETGKLPANAVYISVGSKWEKTYRAGVHGTKEEVLEMHKLELARDPDKLRKVDELQGKDLVCYCAPRLCHGDILLELAAMSFEERLEWAQDYLNQVKFHEAA